jgi:hypothetical protein
MSTPFATIALFSLRHGSVGNAVMATLIRGVWSIRGTDAAKRERTPEPFLTPLLG